MSYVTMTDRFMSGWGLAKNRIAKYVVVCDSLEEAEIVAENARCRSEMRYINIVSKKPHYNATTHQVSFLEKSDCPNSPWYVSGGFRR